MPKRVAEPPLPSPDSFGNYRSRVSAFLSQQERSSRHDEEDSPESSAIGANMSNLKRDNLNVLLRQCVKDLTPEVDEMQHRVRSLCMISQLRKNDPSSSPQVLKSLLPQESGGARDDDIQLLLHSDPDIVKKITSQYSNVMLSQLKNMKEQLDGLLDGVVNTCRPMTNDEKKDLEKSIKELPEKNMDRVADIIGNHYMISGKNMSGQVMVNLDKADNILLWRLHYYVGAVKSAQKLAT
ncbi:unnamed protein product [Cochlearia groenlandica]